MQERLLVLVMTERAPKFHANHEQHPADPRTHLFNGRKEGKKKMRGNDQGKRERKGKKKRKGWREQGGKGERRMEKGRKDGQRGRGKEGGWKENVLSLTFWVFHVYTCSLSIYKISLGAL